MNFIEEFKKFENWLLVHPNVSPSARLVWHSLLHYNNLCGWKEEFDLSMSALQLSTGLSAPTIRKAREQLRLMGRIEYRKGSMDHSAVYRLNPLPSFGAVSSAKERAIDATAGKTSSERTTQRAYERSDTRTNEGTNESTAEGTNTRTDKEDDTRTDERTYERTNESMSETKDERPKETAMESTMESTMESPMESTIESTMESTMESPMESPTESTVKSPTESTMESPMERTEEKSDATFLAKPKQDNTRQSISKESVKKGSDGVLEQPTEQTTDEGAMVEQPTDKSSKQPTDKSSTQSADEDKPFVPPTIEMVRDYCKEKGYHVDPEIFMAYYDSKGWVVGKGPMKSWTRAVAYWEHLDKKRAAEAKERQRRYRQHSYGTKTDSYRTNGQGQASSSAPVRKYHYE